METILQISQAEEGKAWSQYVSIKSRKYFIADANEESWKQGTSHKRKKNEDQKETEVGESTEIDGLFE